MAITGVYGKSDDGSYWIRIVNKYNDVLKALSGIKTYAEVLDLFKKYKITVFKEHE